MKTTRQVAAAVLMVAVLLSLSVASCDQPFETDLFRSIAETVEAGMLRAPDAPSDLRATAVSDSQIDLAWTDNSENEDEFQIQRKTGTSADWETLDPTNVDSTAYSDRGLDAETTYVYQIRAANDLGPSDWSAEASATTEAEPVFTVSYDGNGADTGTVPVDSTEYNSGDSVTVSGPGTMSLTDYTFVGWNTMAVGTGTAYAAGATLVVGTADVILYAQWTVSPTYSLVYNSNGSTGGTVPVDSNQYQEGVSVTVLGNTGNLVRTNFAFVGWNTSPSGDADFYEQGDLLVMPSGGDIIYAQWAPTYTVSYDANGATGSVPVDSNRYKEGDPFTVLGNIGGLAKTGHTFAGWKDSGGASYTIGQDYPMPGHSITLIAQWSASSYTVSYSGNGSDGGSVPSGGSYVFDSQVFVASPGTMSRTGYTFTGWKDQYNSSYSPGGSFNMPAQNLTLYAQWSINSYTVSYSGNGNTGGSVPSGGQYTYGATVTVASPGTMVKYGYVFWRWYDGSAYRYPGNTFSMPAQNVTLVAQWDPYEIGDTGPGGGIIFHVDAGKPEGSRYYECAPKATEWSSKPWGPTPLTVGASGTAVGTGEANTLACVLDFTGSYAPNYCYVLVTGGESDWFLPSRNELRLMYDNLRLQGLGQFVTTSAGNYWSSSEDTTFSSDYNALYIKFSNGAEYVNVKSLLCYVRAIRMF